MNPGGKSGGQFSWKKNFSIPSSFFNSMYDALGYWFYLFRKIKKKTNKFLLLFLKYWTKKNDYSKLYQMTMCSMVKSGNLFPTVNM